METPLPRMARMSDVARAAGVARVTVSRVLNNEGSVSLARQMAVLSAIETLNYRRNFNAGVLAGRRALIVGALTPSLADAGVSQAVGLLSDALTGSGFHLFIGQTHGDPELQRKLLVGFFERRVNAVVFLGNRESLAQMPGCGSHGHSILECWDIEHDPLESSIAGLVHRLRHSGGDQPATAR